MDQLPQRCQLSCRLNQISERLGSYRIRCKSNCDGLEEEGNYDDDVESALRLDGGIPVTSGEFVKRVSSRAYDMRRNLQQTFDSSRYDVKLKENLGCFFSKREEQQKLNDKFQMLVEDVRDGILVFEDENEAAKYCDLIQGKGRGCEYVAEIEASSIFDLCRSVKALAVLFRRGTTAPLPESCELNLRARK